MSMMIKGVGVTLIVVGALLVLFEIAIAIGERHGLRANWLWFAGFIMVGVALISGGVFMVRR